MALRQIYETLNEQGLLKSKGPFRVGITDNSFTELKLREEEIYKPFLIGEETIMYYGETIIVEKEIKKITSQKL